MNRLLLSLTVACFLSLAHSAIAQEAANERTPEVILNDIDGIKYPKFDQERREDEQYIEEYFAERARLDATVADLIFELYKTDPKHEKVEELLPRRWSILMYQPAPEPAEGEGAVEKDALEREWDTIISADPSSKLATEARYLRAQRVMQKNLWTETPDLEIATLAAEEFIVAVPTDARGARLLGMLADAHKDQDQKVSLYQRIRRDYPETNSAKYAAGKIRQIESIGRPFELAFHDAITGHTIDMKNLQGKVVLVDFWATWCGPCVAEMPHLKELYSQYKDQGFEIIGVSLDQPEEQGGLEKLKKFVAEKEIAWPQYYQGTGWEGEFSRDWGINAIPALFLIDKDGNLRSTNARGKLDELIPQLLAE